VGEPTWKKNTQYIESLILNAAHEGNILPLTSSCNVFCKFCSHRQNFAEVEVYRIAPRSRAEVEKALTFMNPARPVVIGESVTRIIEGEPFTHPSIIEILQLVRATFPGTTIQITTNGSLLDKETVEVLRRLGKIVVNLSLNSATEAGRVLLMGDTNASQSIQSAVLLKEHGIPFHGSIVAMPHLVGWQDLNKTIKWLSLNGAQTIRILLPGFSKQAPPALRFEPALWDELYMFIAQLREEVPTPLTCEPPAICDLQPRVTGVIAGSPADRAGIQPGDLIVDINKKPVLTRVHAFNKVLKTSSPEITLKRKNNLITVKIPKKPWERSGLVMDYDIDPELIREMIRVVRQQRASKVLILTSELAGPIIKMALEHFFEDTSEVQVIVARNRFFGGSIKAAGLLTVEDFTAALKEYLQVKSQWQPQLVLLPGLAFDHRGRDLIGRSYYELEEQFGLPAKIL